MTFPYGLSTVQVTGTFAATAGGGSSGSVLFAPSSTVSFAGTVILTTQAVSTQVVAGVMTPVSLIGTDNAELLPTGWNYLVTVNVPGASASFYAYISQSAYGPVVDISQLIPLATPPANNTTYVTSVNGQTGTVILNFPAVTSSLVLAVPPGSAGNVPSLPAGEPGSNTVTGIQIASSFPGDDVSGGIDGTGRIDLYSYQRANVNSFGETIRNFLMRYNAKAMHAWYGPVDLYDGSGNPVTTAGWRPWTWTGSHYEANDGASIHGHWEVEVPDSTGALQGRFEVPFIDSNPNSGTYGQVGVDVTNIVTNQAYFTYNSTWGQFRVAAPAGTVNRVIEFADSIFTGTVYAASSSSARWQIGANATAESGGNAGSNFIITRWSDTATSLGTPLFIQRSDGQTSMGAASALGARLGLQWSIAGQHGFSAQPTVSPTSGAAFDAQMTTTTDRAFQTVITGDANRRLVIDADGSMHWGGGTATQDTNLYWASAGVLQTDQSLAVGANLTVSGITNSTPSPEATGYLAWSCDPFVAGSSASAGNAKSLYLSALFVSSAVTTAKVWIATVNSTGSGSTAGNNWIGLFDHTGALVAQVGIDSLIGAQLGTTSFSWASPAALTPGLYWVGFVVNASVMPQLARASGTFLGALDNLGPSFFRAAINGTNVTTLANITPSANSASNAQAFWCAIS